MFRMIQIILNISQFYILNCIIIKTNPYICIINFNKTKITMTEEKVYSPINDKDIKKNLNDSPIWKNCFHSDDLTTEVLSKNPNMAVYSIKFDGLVPIQVLKVEYNQFK